ncbi:MULTISPECIES: COR domain-containing protein [Cyanophyceae]|uniref:leucine-rich repeat domain-containing protein n=1 Tax=Cyanophyceae TaxID=3028117 RepID=UPI0016829116|nr:MULTISPECIES: COR domain-containing protein [Cyanophyceae]MBD1915774.1 leucine-rich repeat domain-containing protein [Phormidium sp. FACHB-77]MBD2030039.1 leucine-rich repeat domain-containing protein [Phormidium sp. FACHB-322]MBD2052151.1 leucine-rich repeat domain-containing protein [Leptolyngbya sp. FACHB-60]
MTRDELLTLIDQAEAEGWTELDLAGQGLTELPPEIGKLTQLETLILGKWDEERNEDFGNELTSLPLEISQLSNLKILRAPVNQISTIPDSIVQLANLQQLDFWRNQISTIPDSIVQLANLQQLDLSDNQISTIPDNIVQLTNLQQLNLSDNRISTIPDSLAQLHSLQQLNLGDNQISTIPDSLAQLANLQQLYLWKNRISTIPDSIAQLRNLQHLNLGGNQISVIPDSIAQLANLQKLHIWSNRISAIPNSIAQIHNLKQLNLSSNQISAIPDSLAQLHNLQQLYLWDNQISAIPDSLAQLQNLQKLYLFNNQIDTIPDSLAQLQSLQELYLSDNKISVIPDSLAQLQSLQELYLSNNKISAIPESLESLSQLEALGLRGNPLPISPEILEPPERYQDPGSVEGIFNYLRQLRSGDVKPLNEAKLLLVGQGTVGKTSLAKRLIENRFDSNEFQTDGLDVREWGVHVNSKDVRLNVWDFGGQEIYHATHQFFLTKRSLYLLVCNCRTSEDENRIEYWLKLIQSFGSESPVIIVGNKKDEQPFDINRKALRDKYPSICAILETSCQSGDGIEELREAITKEVGQLHDVYNLLPLSWFEVKEQLEAMDRDFISYNEYIGICHRNQIPEEQNQTQLIDLLHNLGLVLNFRDHPILQSTNVLNPAWVTEGIYALLSDETLKTKGKGILTYDDLRRVLDPQRYPGDRHRYLTELMQEFQLCFELPDCSCPRFLIPGLLPKDEPEDTGLAGDTLEFQYHYRILPESVLSRFIVLSHEKIHEQTCWRSGVMLAYFEGNEQCNIARVKADPEDKKIFISISGRETTRRVFLALIRDTFTKIHKSFGDLEVTEWVPVPDHPDHPPLDYQELMGLEAMGEQTVTIGKLRLRLNLRQLLDGYESQAARQQRQLKESGMDIEERYGGIHLNIHQGSRATHQHGKGDNVAGDLVQGDKIQL